MAEMALIKRFREWQLWMIFAVLIEAPDFFVIYRRNEDIGVIFEDKYLYMKFFIAVLIVLYPIVFEIIFGDPPLTRLGKKRKEKQNNKVKQQTDIENLGAENKKAQTIETQMHPLKLLAIESDHIASRIDNRAKVYLLIGCLIAFGGLFIFYFPFSENNLTQNVDMLNEILNYLPRYGSLLFIELIAFFFLKQYKISMEEYRYYERIKRRRQDNYTILELIERYTENEDILKYIFKYCIFENNPHTLTKDQTTEILELHKTNGDFELLDKIIELTKSIKK